MKRLKDKADILPPESYQPLFIQRFHVHAVYDHLALCRLFQPGQHIEQCRFSRTGRAYDRAEFSLVNCKIDAVQRPDYGISYAIQLVKIFHFDYFFHVTLHPFCRIHFIRYARWIYHI